MNLRCNRLPPEPGGSRANAWSRWAVLVAALALGGCSSAGYYWQAVNGHWELMRAARPVTDWVAEPQTPEALRERLKLSQRIREFATDEMQLPDNASYRRYADLGRPAVVWNIVAAPADSLVPKTWCFPVAGCVSYRGYFNEADARAEARALEEQGLETSVYGVPAYSTLGWMNWAGGDPLVSTFVHYPEGELARLMFHELAHQVVYAKDDTMFNESFATAVERLGGERWLILYGSPAAREAYASFDARRKAFRALTLSTRRELEALYKENKAHPSVDGSLIAMKMEVMQRFRDRYAVLKASWGGDPAQYRGFDVWVARANNASFAAQASYDELVPGFERLFRKDGGFTPQGWRQFYDAVKQLAAMPVEERRRVLKESALVTHQNSP
jgi:predicted aminopeptidase